MASGWNLWVWLQCIGVVSGCCCKEVQWNPSKVDTLGPPYFVHYSEMSFIEGLCLILN